MATAKRNLLNERWGVHLSISRKRNIYNLAGDYVALVKLGNLCSPPGCITSLVPGS